MSNITKTTSNELSISILNVENIHNAALMTETANIDSTVVAMVKSEQDKQTALGIMAKALDRISRSGLYKADFKSITDYVEAIGLADTGVVTKSQISQLAASGIVYNDEKAPDNLKHTAPYALSGAQGSIKDDKKRAMLYDMARKSDKKSFTQNDMRDMNATVANKLGKPKSNKAESLYYGKLNGKTASGPVESPAKYADWEEWAKVNYDVVLPIKADESKSKRIVCIKGSKAELLVLSTKGKPKTNKSKTNKSK